MSDILSFFSNTFAALSQMHIGLYIGYTLQVLFLLLGVYYFIVSIFSFFPRRYEAAKSNKNHSFALIVPAHNEQAVIANIVKSLKSMDYPKDRYEIFVVADNCTDNTAQIARDAGATVYERTNATERGKGYTLEWMFNKIFEMDKHFDYFSIFDADNVVDKNFLKAMNFQANRGHKAIQGYIDSKNPNDSWISYSYSLSFWTVNKLFQQSRANLRLGCQLCGTGFSVQTNLIKEMGWRSTCLTEDMEFTMRLSQNNINVAWANDAVIYDEKPITFSQSWKQRKRWMQGHADVASRFVVPLTKKAFKERKLAPLDCVLYLLQPLRIISMGVITIMAWIQTAYPESRLIIWGLIPTAVWNTVVILQFMWAPVVLISQKRFTFRTIWGYPFYMLYTLSWVPIAVIGIIHKNKTEWFHTQHTRTISIDEVS